MVPLKEYRNWPRRAFFLFLVICAFFVINRPFSLLLVAAVFIALETIFTRIANQRKVINEYFKHYTLYQKKKE